VSDNFTDKISAAFAEHRRLLDQFEKSGAVASIADAARIIVESLRNGGTIYVCGNGGSAADAQHITGELVGRFLKERKGYRAVALTTDTSILTSVGNDYSFDSIYSRQVEALAKPGDVLIALSTSGSSKNILAAAKSALGSGAKVVAFTGKSNSELETIADVTICAVAPTSAQSQELHQIAYHLICGLVEESLCG
jgi:D-sedoheptulose 7-phosphate isomerase